MAAAASTLVAKGYRMLKLHSAGFAGGSNC
jgi:hypothetical protein